MVLGIIRDHVSVEATIMTDEARAYVPLTKEGWKHQSVRHSTKEYVRGNFWSLFKRGVIGTFHQVSVKHLHRYLNAFSFRFNNREAEDLFGLIIVNLAIGTALRYKALTAKPDASPDAA